MGQPLSEIYTPPTDEQLGNFVRALLVGEAKRRNIGPINEEFAVRMVLNNPTLKAIWLERHRELSERVSHG